MSPTTTTHLTGVATVIIPVSNQAKAVAFYTEKLGFHKLRDAPLPDGQRWIEVGPDAAGTSIALMPANDELQRASVSFATGDAAAAHAALQAGGIDVDAALLDYGPGVPPMFTFRDPDGNNFRVVEIAR